MRHAARSRLNRRRANQFAKITMRAAGVTGCTASLIVPPHRCGSASETERQNPIWKGARRSSRFMPKASAPKFHQSNGSRPAMPSWRSGNTHGFCVTGGLPPIASEPTPSPRLWATPPGATPARLCEHTMRVPNRTANPELSTWLGIGTFYLAPTGHPSRRSYPAFADLVPRASFRLRIWPSLNSRRRSAAYSTCCTSAPASIAITAAVAADCRGRPAPSRPDIHSHALAVEHRPEGARHFHQFLLSP